jgi:hypothetical protein
MALAIGGAAAGCGTSSSSGGSTSATAADPNAPEVSPAGDIPDNQAFVPYTAPGAGASVTVPEGWSRTTTAGAVTFTDKLNAIRIEHVTAPTAPTAAQASKTEVPKLAATVKGFSGARVSTVQRKSGPAIRITYLATARPNAVTGKAGRDAVERYVFHDGTEDLVLTLSGPEGADNVDPWRIVTDSVTWTR